MDVLVPLSNIFDDRKTVTEDNNKHSSIYFEEESGSLNDTVVEKKLQKRNLKHRSPEDDEHSILRLKESNKKTITKPRRNLRIYELTLYEGGLNECSQCKLKTPTKGDLHKGVCVVCRLHKSRHHKSHQYIRLQHKSLQHKSRQLKSRHIIKKAPVT